MLKRKTNRASARSFCDESPIADPSVAVARLAAERPLGRATFRGRLEYIFLRSTKRGVWGYLVLVLIVFSIVHFETDRWWLGTALSCGPKWPGLVPLALLVPLAAVLRARLLLPLIASALVYLFGIMGLCVPWPWDAAQAVPTEMVTMMSWNAEGGATDWKSVRQLIDNEDIGIVALQDSGQAIESVLPEGWHVAHAEGLILASRYPIKDQQIWRREQLPPTRQQAVALYALIDRPEGPLAVCCIQLGSPFGEPNGLLDRASISNLNMPDQIQLLDYWRDRESEELSKWIAGLPQIDVIAGDFNMPVESQIYRRWWNGYVNAFSKVGSGFGWTRLANCGRIRFGLRVDHVLVADSWAAANCKVGPKITSDHMPVIVQIVPAGK
jgi:vancomycin resistance protein VanJ